MGKPGTGADSDKSRQYRFRVSRNDRIVLEWIRAQTNLSSSVRTLIAEDVIRNGGFEDTAARAPYIGGGRRQRTVPKTVSYDKPENGTAGKREEFSGAEDDGGFAVTEVLREDEPEEVPDIMSLLSGCRGSMPSAADMGLTDDD